MTPFACFPLDTIEIVVDSDFKREIAADAVETAQTDKIEPSARSTQINYA